MKLTLMPLVAAILLSVQAARADDNNHLSITVGDWPPYFDQEAHGQGMVARLVRGRIDAFPEEINVGYHILRRELTPSAARQIVHHPRAILENKSFLLFPRATDFESRELLGKFNRRLQAFRASGRYQRYFNTEEHAAALLPADQATSARLKSAPIITPEW